MKNYDTRVYSISDFFEWNNSGLLELSVEFQRRSVWSQNAKSFLIDTVIRGKPMPKIIISQELSGSRMTRKVVDGQQRLRAILEYIDGAFKISVAHNKEYAGFSFEMLPDDIQDDFMQYELGVDVIFGMSYEELLDIFARINTYTVPLNTQEKRNAKFVGFFKQFVYRYGRNYVRYFIDGGILAKHRVARMAEAELSAELFVALISGVQTNKNTGQFYIKFEEEIGNLEREAQHFDTVMSYIGSIYPPEDINQTNWSRVHLFYTLFTSVAHILFGLEGPDAELRFKINKGMVRKLRVQLDEISAKFDEVAEMLDSEDAPEDYRQFIDLSRRRTTDTSARIGRTNFVCEKLKEALT